MATLEQQAKGGSKGEIRYLTPLKRMVLNI